LQKHVSENKYFKENKTHNSNFKQNVNLFIESMTSTTTTTNSYPRRSLSQCQHFTHNTQ